MGVGSSLQRTIKTDSEGAFQFIGKTWAIQGKLNGPGKVGVTSWVVTQVGTEIFSLLEDGDEEAKYRRLGSAILESHRTKLERLEILSLGSEVSPRNYAILKQENLLSE